MTAQVRGRGRATAVILASMIALAGCTSEPDKPAGGAGGVVRVQSVEPQNPLVPGDTAEVAGEEIVRLVFSGLVYYDENGEAHNDAADSITTDDGSNYLITLRKGLAFSSGERVTSASFVDAWNFTARLSNGMKQADAFHNVAGYDATADSELTGLTVIDDTRFSVALTSPVADFAQQLGSSAFFPLPSEAYADLAAFGQNPVGNGPYRLAGPDAWEHGRQIELVVNADYSGPRTPKNSGVTFAVYLQLEAAYRDVQAGDIDVLRQIPPSAMDSYGSDFPASHTNQPSAVLARLGFPSGLPHFGGQEGVLRRRAISLAIDRDEISTVLFGGTISPATGFVSPAIVGAPTELRGSEYLEHDAARAAELWRQADALAPWSGTLPIAYNADGGHRDWVDAVANQLRGTLGVDVQGSPVPSFAQLRQQIADGSVGGAFRISFGATYPSVLGALEPVFATGARINDVGYANPEFDASVTAASAERDESVRQVRLAQAQRILLQDLPQIPLWYQNTTAVWSPDLHGVTLGWDGLPAYWAIVRD